MLPPPSGAVTVPSQSEVTFAGDAIVTPAGRLSVNARLPTADEPTFVMLNRRVVTLPGPMVSGENTLLKVGCASAACDAISVPSNKKPIRNRLRPVYAILCTG